MIHNKGGKRHAAVSRPLNVIIQQLIMIKSRRVFVVIAEILIVKRDVQILKYML